ncbi:MAG: hypothetical protein Q9220_005489 [cf. Caloplaca sp. 1 TL-2023]
MQVILIATTSIRGPNPAPIVTEIAVKLTPNDLTYDLARLAIVSDLEPLLGIIAACAPFFPPTFRKLVGGTRRIFSTASDSRDSRKGIIKGSGNPKFQVLDDSYPLTDTRKGRNETNITSSNSQAGSLLNGYEAAYRESPRQGQNINVKRGWEVSTDKGGY